MSDPAHTPMTRERQLAKLALAVEAAITVYEEKAGISASRTWPMIDRYGHVEALSRLVVSADLQKGFRVLRDADLLDMTFEALVVRHSSLFRPPVVEAADWRLKNPHSLLSP